MSKKKEPHFFGQDLYDPSHIRSEVEYLALFDDAKEAKIVGEASVWSLYSQTAADEIFHFEPDAKILIMLRSPLEMMISLHGKHRFCGYQEVDEFTSALKLQLSGKGERQSESFRRDIHYLNVASYKQQVDRFLLRFGSDNIHIIFFDDFAKCPDGIFAETLSFLGVDPIFRPERFVQHNAQPRFRSHRANKIYERVLALAIRLRAGHLVTRQDSVSLLMARIPQDLREQLFGYLEPSITELGLLTSRDLSHWLRTSKKGL